MRSAFNLQHKNADTVVMSVSPDFEKKLYAAEAEKAIWYDTTLLPKLTDEYRNYRAVVNTIMSMLLKKGLIQDDPYKLDKKIADITVPDSTDFKENERTSVLGTRLSEYESSLEYLCNYFKFSVENLTIECIRKLVSLNNYIVWNALMGTSANQINRALGEMLTSIKMGSNNLSVGVLNDSISFASKSLAKINSILKDLTEFKKEQYKIAVRKTVLDNPSFANERANLTPANGVQAIKKHFVSGMGKQPFYTELIEELVREESSADSPQLCSALLEKMRISSQKTENEKPGVNTKLLLLEAIQIFAALSPQLNIIAPKLEENHHLLKSEHSGIWDRFKTLLRKAFHLNEKPVEYKLKIRDAATQTVKNLTVNFNDFVESLARRSRLYASFGIPKSSSVQKIASMDEKTILDYVQRQLSECHSMQTTLGGLDEFFKASVTLLNRRKVKGIQIELTTVKNTLIKINQRKAEYLSVISEREQMKKLGVSNV